MEVDIQFPLLLEGRLAVAFISVVDLPERTYCIIVHIHFAEALGLMALSLEKGRTYQPTPAVVVICAPCGTRDERTVTYGLFQRYSAQCLHIVLAWTSRAYRSEEMHSRVVCSMLASLTKHSYVTTWSTSECRNY